MSKLKNLPGYKKLSKDEKERLKKVHGGREKTGYNMTGGSSISRTELKKAKAEQKKLNE